MVFANPLYLLLLLLIIPVIAWYILKQKRMQAALQVSTTQPYDKKPRTYKIYLRHFMMTAARRMISGRVPTMISNLSLPLSANFTSE